MSLMSLSANPQRLRLGLARATGYPVTVVGFVIVVLALLAAVLGG